MLRQIGTMKPLLQKILIDSPVITDGGWVTQLQLAGVRAGECPDLWNISHPDEVEKLAHSYVEAGSKIILSNTFRSNRLSLESYGLTEKLREINSRGIALSLEAARGKSLVFGSMGPARPLSSGPQLPEEALFNSFKEQADIFSAEGAEGIVIETFTDLHETTLAVLAAKTTGLPVVACMVFDSGPNRSETASGHTPEQAASALEKAGADVVGANCGPGVEWSLPVCKRLHQSTKLPIWMKPSAGIPQMLRGKVYYPTSPRNFALYAQVLANLGADFVGGCCGTSPEYVSEMSRNLRRRYGNQLLLPK